MSWRRLFSNPDDAALKRLRQTVEDLDKITRRLGRDYKLVGGDGPLRAAYAKLLNAHTEIDQYIARVEGSHWGR